MTRALGLLALLVTVGCTTDSEPPPPSATLDPSADCSGDVYTCLNAGATTHSVSGVHVIHKRVEGDPVIAVDIFIDGGDRGGMQLWSEAMALDMLGDAGPKDLGLVAWRAANTQIGASVYASMGRDYGIITAVAPVPYWSDVWDLLARALKDPSNDDYLLDYLRGYIEHSYETELDDPGTAATVTAWSSLFQGTLGNRFRETREDANSVSMADIDEAWAGMLTKDRLWVVVVGDVAWSDVADKVSRAFGAIPTRHATRFAPPPASPPPPIDDQAAVLDYPDAPNWQVYGYFLGPPPTDSDYAPLSVAMELLDRRLFREVRDVRGLAYSVGASLFFGRQSTGALSLATDAPNDALPVVKQVISDLVSTPVSDDELAGVSALLQSSLIIDYRTPPDMAYALGAYQLTMGDRLGIDAYATALSSVTAESARSALDRYFRAVSLAAAGPGGVLNRTSLLGVLPYVAAPDGGVGDASEGGLRDSSGGGFGDASDGDAALDGNALTDSRAGD